MINYPSPDDLIPLAAVPQHLPVSPLSGLPFSLTSVRNWVTKGRRGLKLATVKGADGKPWVKRSALAAWCEAQRGPAVIAP